MSVKFSTVRRYFKFRCQSASYFLQKNFEHSCDQVVSEWYFQKKYHNGDESRSHPAAVLPLVLDKK